MLSDEDGAEERERERSSSILGLDENSEDELEDSSAVRATDGNLGIKGVPPFISKIYSMLETPSLAGLISWSDPTNASSSTSFSVSDPTEFSRTIIPQFFKHNNWQSFVRQLNMYGFHKVNESGYSVNSPYPPPLSCSWDFYHSHFQRGRPEFLLQIKRKTTKQTGGSGIGSTSRAPNRKPNPGPSRRGKDKKIAVGSRIQRNNQMGDDEDEINSTASGRGTSSYPLPDSRPYTSTLSDLSEAVVGLEMMESRIAIETSAEGTLPPSVVPSPVLVTSTHDRPTFYHAASAPPPQYLRYSERTRSDDTGVEDVTEERERLQREVVGLNSRLRRFEAGAANSSETQLATYNALRALFALVNNQGNGNREQIIDARVLVERLNPDAGSTRSHQIFQSDLGHFASIQQYQQPRPTEADQLLRPHSQPQYQQHRQYFAQFDRARPRSSSDYPTSRLNEPAPLLNFSTATPLSEAIPRNYHNSSPNHLSRPTSVRSTSAGNISVESHARTPMGRALFPSRHQSLLHQQPPYPLKIDPSLPSPRSPASSSSPGSALASSPFNFAAPPPALSPSWHDRMERNRQMERSRPTIQIETSFPVDGREREESTGGGGGEMRGVRGGNGSERESEIERDSDRGGRSFESLLNGVDVVVKKEGNKRMFEGDNSNEQNQPSNKRSL